MQLMLTIQFLKKRKTEKRKLINSLSIIHISVIFEDNKGKSLDDAIKCWKFKKQLKGHNKYERSDLDILK